MKSSSFSMFRLLFSSKLNQFFSLKLLICVPRWKSINWCLSYIEKGDSLSKPPTGLQYNLSNMQEYSMSITDLKWHRVLFCVKTLEDGVSRGGYAIHSKESVLWWWVCGDLLRRQNVSGNLTDILNKNMSFSPQGNHCK